MDQRFPNGIALASRLPATRRSFDAARPWPFPYLGIDWVDIVGDWWDPTRSEGLPYDAPDD
jgi:hypothetical protein